MTNDELQSAFRLYYRNIFNLCYKCLGHFQNAEDVTFSTFMEICKKADNLDFNKIEGFLIVTAKWKVVDLQRRDKKWRQIVEHLPANDLCFIHDNIDANILATAMDKLPPRMKQVLQLIYIEGYNRNEVAEITKLSPNTVRNTIVAALSKLKQLVLCEE